MRKLCLFLFAGLILLPPVTFADHRGKEYSQEEYACPITDKIMKKAHFYLENQKELGLSEDQANQIKQIKIEAKKAYIRQMADHEIAQLDIQQAISQPKVDVTAANKVIDNASSSMNKFGKETVATFAKLKEVLRAEQQAKAKEFWMGGKTSS